MAHTEPSDLMQLLTRWQRWYRLRRGLDWASYGLIAGLFLGLCVGAEAIFQGWLLRAEFFLLVAGLTLACIIISLVCGIAWPTSIHQTARVFDHSLNLKERLSTALEFSLAAPRSHASPELVRLQLDDTLRHSRQVNLRHALPMRIKRLNILTSALLVLFIVLLAWRGAPSFERTAAQRQVEQAISRQIEQIEALQSDILSNNDLTAQAQQELLQILEQAALQLNEAESTEQAISILAEAQQALSQINDSQLQSLSQALQSVGASLSQQANNPLASFGQQLAANELALAAEELAAMDLSNLSTEQLQALAEQLSEAAQALQSSAPELAESLRQAAAGIRAGEIQAAEQALAQASQSLQQSAGQIAQSQAAAQIASQLAGSQQQILQAAQTAGMPSGQSGAASSSQNAQSAASGGAGRGESENSEGTGPEAGEDPISQNNAPGDGGESLYQPLYPPERLGGSIGDLVTVPGNAETGELILEQGNISPGSQNRTTVPYIQVYAYYNQIYRQAIENGEIPASLRFLVSDYFTSLEP
jgi:hypothetical protein